MKRLCKLKSREGFSLAETLLAVLILLLVSVIVATGMPAARSAYEKIIIGANAQTMLSTAVTALRDELGTAWDIEVSADNKSVTYSKADTGTKATLGIDNAAYAAITLTDFVADDFIHGRSKEGNSHHLVPDKNSDLFATYNRINYDDAKGIIQIYGLKVCLQKDQSRILARLGENDEYALEIRVLSASAAS